MNAARRVLSESVPDPPPPPPGFDSSQQPDRGQVENAAHRSSTKGSARADEIAVVGFWCSIGFLVVLPLGVFTGQPFLFWSSVVLMLVGLGLSIAGASRRNTSRGPRRLAIVGIVIPIVAIIAIPILIVVALVSFYNNF